VGENQARRSATALYVIVSALFWVPLAGAVFGIPLSISTMVGSDKPLAVHAFVPSSEVGEPPAGLELPRLVAVVAPIGHVTAAQVATFEVGLVLAALAYLLGAWQLRELVRTIREEDAFVRANVRRLRLLAGLFLFGYPVFQWASGVWNAWVLSTAGPPDTAATVPLDPLSFPAILGGLCLVVLAEVFARGIVLREDVEATV
jgi:DUF2975 family protein